MCSMHGIRDVKQIILRYLNNLFFSGGDKHPARLSTTKYLNYTKMINFLTIVWMSILYHYNGVFT
jgi:hypothetical protein